MPSLKNSEETFLQAMSRQGKTIIIQEEQTPGPSMRVHKKTGGRPAGSKNKKITLRMQRAIEMVSRGGTVEFFRSILDDKTEAELWMMFWHGKALRPVLDANKQPVLNPDGSPLMAMQEVELNPTSLKAFLRAVEYKRGQPVQPIEAKGREIDVVEVITLGAGEDYFREQAKLAGLLAS